MYIFSLGRIERDTKSYREFSLVNKLDYVSCDLFSMLNLSAEAGEKEDHALNLVF